MQFKNSIGGTNQLEKRRKDDPQGQWTSPSLWPWNSRYTELIRLCPFQGIASLHWVCRERPSGPAVISIGYTCDFKIPKNICRNKGRGWRSAWNNACLQTFKVLLRLFGGRSTLTHKQPYKTLLILCNFNQSTLGWWGFPVSHTKTNLT